MSTLRKVSPIFHLFPPPKGGRDGPQGYFINNRLLIYRSWPCFTLRHILRPPTQPIYYVFSDWNGGYFLQYLKGKYR